MEGRVGLYRIVICQTVPGGIVFTGAGGSGLLDDAGFAWRLDGPRECLGDTFMGEPAVQPDRRRLVHLDGHLVSYSRTAPASGSGGPGPRRR